MTSTIEFKHANNGSPLVVFTSQIFACMWLSEAKCVGVVGPGSALIPVAGTLEEVVNAVKAAKLKEGETKNV